YRRVERDQQFLMPPDMREWLPEGDPVWLVIEAVAQLDAAGLHALRRTGGVGRAGYDPDMLLTVLIWAWAQGQRSSRVIERLCVRDVGFRVICGGNTPDHVTIARFRAQMTDVAEELFAQVLMLCARLGLGRLGVVAMDSVKISSNASLAANRSADGLRKAAAEQAVADAARVAARAAAAAHAACDAGEDAEFGPEHRADAVPAELGEPSARAARISQALAELEAETEAARAADDAVAARKTRQAQNKTARRDALVADHRRRRDESGSAIKGKPPAEIRVEMLARNLAQARAAQQAEIDAYDRRRTGRAPAPVEQYSMVKRVRLAWERAVTETVAAHQQSET
ncbi:transposase, partial [Nocardia sp. NPDC059091]|uniref:transposase n=1 Tax=Nocardia sp. NPDC059091 TaxID=3346724 RepID=UPI0036CF9C23